MGWFNKLTTSQWWAASRHYITFAFGLLGGIGIISVVQQHDALGAIDDIASGLVKIATGIGTLLTIFAPIVNGWIAKNRASPTSQIASVAEMAKDPTMPVKGVIVEATPEGKALANSIPGPVIPAGTPQAIDLAKNGG